MKITCDKENPPLGGFLSAEFYKSLNNSINVVWGSSSTVMLPKTSKSISFETSNDLIRLLEKTFNQGSDHLHKLILNHWLTFSISFESKMPESLEYLDKTLGPLTYLVGESLSVSDLAVFSILHVSTKFSEICKTNPLKNIHRWMKVVKAHPSISKALNNLPADVMTNMSNKLSSRKSPEVNGKRAQEGKFVELPNAEMGKVVVRFPPEASGYLHIGHAKAALLNQYYQQAFEGKLIMRFDDTNPAKEDAEFEKEILGDLEMLEIKPDLFTHTSQYFDLMLGYCEKLIKESKAFVDDTSAEQMKTEREQRIESKNRNNSVEQNLRLWQEMKAGSAIGVKCCVRAKLDMQSPNGCLRDPTIYRCKPEPHPRTGTQYKVYPTYDFACPIVDSIEGVTHVLRTMEYHDRDPQFYWFIEALGLRKPYIWEYSRLNMTNTVLSKRKLTWFVEQKLVDGWDDPRMPTVRGVLRRGMTVEGLRQFIQTQGSSRSVVSMEWDKIWAINKKVIDPIAPRYTAVESNPVPVNLKGINSDSTLTVALHPKNPDVGNKNIWVSKKLLIDQADATLLQEGNNTTFINYGNVMIDKIHRSSDGIVTSIDATPNLDNKDFKKTLKITWLADTPQSPMVDVYCVYFDHIISKSVLGKDEDFKQYIDHETRWEVPLCGEPELAKVREGDIIQLQRRGFFRVDVASAPPSQYSGKAQPLILFHVPDGHTKEKAGQSKPASAMTNEERTGVKTTSAANKEAQNGDQLNIEIKKQGDMVRELKEAKADKSKIDEAVKKLLALKAKYQDVTGKKWEPVVTSSENPMLLNRLIMEQCDVVLELKHKNAKEHLETGIIKLQELKQKYKQATGKEWIPETMPRWPAPSVRSAENAERIKQQLIEQSYKIGSLKAKKADRVEFNEAVKVLHQLKGKYREASGQKWVPIEVPPALGTVKSTEDATELNRQIIEQGDLVRSLKADKADKVKIDEAVKELLQLKTKYNEATGQKWVPGVIPPPSASVKSSQNAAKVPKVVPSPSVSATSTKNAAELNRHIIEQGDLVRSLKADKADKVKIDEAVKELLQLKAKYNEATGQKWIPGVVPPSAAPVKSSENATELNRQIIEQGDVVRSLKADKADKVKIDDAVKELLQLKTKFNEATGQKWIPGLVPSASVAVKSSHAEVPKVVPSPSVSVTSTKNAAELNRQIMKQGDVVRSLKADKSDKVKIDEAVKELLQLKAKYNEATGQKWIPGIAPPSAPVKSSDDATELNRQIIEQGDVVRSLKANKADKVKIDEAVKELLQLKAKYKDATGQDWKPNTQSSATQGGLANKKNDRKHVIDNETLLGIKGVVFDNYTVPNKLSARETYPATTHVHGLSLAGSKLYGNILEQEQRIKKLREAKANKVPIQEEVQVLANMKVDFKKVSGLDWTHSMKSTPILYFNDTEDDKIEAVAAQIKNQGKIIKQLISSKVSKDTIDVEEKRLDELTATHQVMKAEIEQERGCEYVPQKVQRSAKPKKINPKEQSPRPAPSSAIKKITRLGIEASKEDELSEWYSQVITKAEMIEYYDISGCYILRPWSYSIWDLIREFLSTELKKLGVKDCYFPIFVSKAVLEREQTHIADFAPEVAWVTRSGGSELAEPVAVRPTSETVMYPAYAKWLQSHRDLPLRLNQWNNVVRWEFKQPQPFLRSREFLWQEGHTAFSTREEADAEVLQILELYASVYEDLLAVPVIKGRKTEKEKFAGGDYTTTVEAYVPASGRGIQGATSHHLGQNFSKMFDIVYDDPETQEKKYVYQNSWGLTTRTIGVMTLVHGDGRGLVLAPRVAAAQVVLVPCGLSASAAPEPRARLRAGCRALLAELLAAGLRAEGDFRDNYSPGWKFNHWELKGVPIRVEVGPKDMARDEIVAVKRFTGEKVTLKRANCHTELIAMLETIHHEMLNKATQERDSRLSLVTAWAEFTAALEMKHMLLSPFCGEIACEDNIKRDSARVDEDPNQEIKAPAMGAKSLCIPFQQPRDLLETDKCIHPTCDKKPKFFTLFGRSY